MAEHIWTVLCRKKLADEDDGLVSLIDVFERIAGDSELEDDLRKATQSGQRGVSFPIEMRLVSWWIRSDDSKPETIQTRLGIVSPSGEQLTSQEIPVDLTATTSARATVRFTRMVMAGFGRYWFVVEKHVEGKGKSRWLEVAKLPIEIVRPDAAAPT